MLGLSYKAAYQAASKTRLLDSEPALLSLNQILTKTSDSSSCEVCLVARQDNPKYWFMASIGNSLCLHSLSAQKRFQDVFLWYEIFGITPSRDHTRQALESQVTVGDLSSTILRENAGNARRGRPKNVVDSLIGTTCNNAPKLSRGCSQDESEHCQ